MIGEGLEKIYLSKSRTFLSFCFCFIFGVGVFSLSFDKNVQFYLYLSIFFCLFCLIIFWNHKLKKFLFLSLLFFILGGLRFYFSIPQSSNDNLKYYNNHLLKFKGKVSSELIQKENGVQAIVSAISVDERVIKGKVLLFMGAYSDLKFGDFADIECDLLSPEGNETFINYDKYLARDGIWSICYRPKIKIVIQNKTFIEKIKIGFFEFKNNIQTHVNNLWVEPQGALMSGLLYGARSSLGSEVTNNFNKAGITHIIAISGYNISILANILMGLLLLIGLNRRHAFWFAVIGIFLFVIFTGASASVVRAGIMGIIVLLATQLGKASRITNVLIFTAALMLLFNPFILIWDAGFQLSFLATMGLVYVSPIIEKYFNNDNGIILNNLKTTLISTISAIIITLPLILFQFGRLSLVAPLANILILWIIPFLMLFGFLALLLSYIFLPAAMVLAWISNLGLLYVLTVAQYLADWEFSSVNFHLPLLAMLGLYLLIISWVGRANRD